MVVESSSNVTGIANMIVDVSWCSLSRLLFEPVSLVALCEVGNKWDVIIDDDTFCLYGYLCRERRDKG